MIFQGGLVKNLGMFVIVLSALCGFNSNAGSKNGSALTTVSAMSYNVENLFDTQKDAGKNDWEYLPKAKKHTPEHKAYCDTQTGRNKDACFNLDWSENTLKAKMRNVADAVLQINGRGPDVLMMTEVENERVLKQFNSGYLQAANYQTAVLIEGDDKRGIDNAVLSRFPLAREPKLHRINFKETVASGKKAPLTRGILEVPLRLPNGQVLFAYVVHFPSAANPSVNRLDAVNTLLDIVQNQRDPSDLVVVGGDFNIITEEEQSQHFIEKLLAPVFGISHEVGCGSCQGSHYYQGEWSFLDMHLYSQSLMRAKGGYQLDPNSIRTPNEGKYQTRKDGTPFRFDPNNQLGVSDHLPIYSEFEIQ